MSVGPGVQQIGTPTSVTDDNPGSDAIIKAFDEIQGLTLDDDLSVDGGTIVEGTRINSHMVFANRETGSALVRLSGSVTFDGMILGVISNTAQLGNTDALLGPGTTYDTFTARGLEFGGANGDGYEVSGSVFTADEFVITQPGDWVRVITAATIPVPASAALLPMGFGALVALRRRKKKADAA
ncbi:VPLPA-CTERM sorting domain-containing protein [Primorskyibacter sp. S187A]|uniref:VPLPA-CTERM sorting domain-containing protein n=1 Tax=Primorskyibacter sp. S187A TaxID=3415130 RepID=UPI003C79D696